MKKTLLLGFLALTVVACADISQYTAVDSNASAQTRMKACLINEANTKLQSGTLFANTLTATSNELVNICLKKLALQAAGIDEEAQSTAQSIISSLQNFRQTN